jgi:predicted MPP superfamily phosphohydrolase
MAALKMASFATFALLVHVGGTAYITWRLGWPVAGKWRFLMAAAALFYVALIPTTFWVMRVEDPNALHRAMQWAGYLLMGLWSVLLGGVLLWDMGRLLLHGVDVTLRLAGRPTLSSVLLPSRAEALAGLANWGRWGIAILGLLITIWGYIQASIPPRTVTVDVPVRNLPAALDGLRIVQISDIHLTPLSTAGETGELVRQVNALQPDLVAVTGDLVDGTTAALRDAVTPLAGLAAPLGTWFVTGNHEYYSGVDTWLAMTETLGWNNLVNSHAVLERNGATVLLAGVTDVSAQPMGEVHRSDPRAAIAGAPKSDVRILLAHQPKSARQALDLGFDLILSGHTHGGQFFPWCLIVPLVQPYSSGYFLEGTTHIYTSPGTGYWGPPNRAGVPAEITVLRLVSSS